MMASRSSELRHEFSKTMPIAESKLVDIMRMTETWTRFTTE